MPYVAQWSSESERFIRHDKYADGAAAIFTLGQRGETVPVFGKMNEARQRECMWLSICQVCGQRLHRRFAVEAPHQRVQRGKDTTPLLSEPAACATCMMYSLTHCPGINRLKDDPETLFMEWLEWTLVQQWLQPAGDGGELDAVLIKYGAPCVGYLKAMVTKANVYTYDNFVKELSGAEVKQ